ncbi:hypothetical protein JHK85_044276 [Glycine max]|nr:hypothetical protein JHK86_043606 [Glycine max]KAG4957896.1 hypothetical protein JHK85_044276 [Glycine max]
MTASSNLTQGSNLPNVVAATVLLEFNGKRFAPSPSPRSKDKEALGDLAFIDAANSLHQKEPITSLSRPFWFTKLWLNSIFRKHLRQDARFSLALELEGARLVYYTSTGKPLEQSFRKYIKVLMKMIDFTKDLAPVVHLLIARPECLKKTFLIETPVPKKISEDDDASNDESGDKEPKQGKGKKMKPPKKTKSSTMTKDGSVVNISSSQEQEVESDQDRNPINPIAEDLMENMVEVEIENMINVDPSPTTEIELDEASCYLCLRNFPSYEKLSSFSMRTFRWGSVCI